jgi:3-methyladenine DNA glycosylase/8-oxoguanine DNA glycosylase
MQCATTMLTISPPFDLKAMALSGGWHECAPISWCEAGGCLQLIERHHDRVFRVGITQTGGRRGKVGLRLLVEAVSLDDDDVEEMRRRVAVALRADEDFTEFHALCRKHPTLHILPQIGAGRTLRSYSMAENVLKMLCGTNVTWAQAVKMINRIAQLGPYLPDHRHLNAWPTANEILRAGKKYLLEVARVGYRAEAILEFCARVRSGELDPESYDRLARTEPTEVLLKELLSIRGIGPTSAHYLLSMLGHYDHLSIDSTAVAHVARAYLGGRRPTCRQIEAVYARFGRWKQLVWWFEQWLTWDSARTIIAAGSPH